MSQHDSFNVAGMHVGPTGADNDSKDSNGDALTAMVMNAPTSFSGGVGSGQQAPVSGS